MPDINIDALASTTRNRETNKQAEVQTYQVGLDEEPPASPK